MIGILGELQVSHGVEIFIEEYGKTAPSLAVISFDVLPLFCLFLEGF